MLQGRRIAAGLTLGLALASPLLAAAPPRMERGVDKLGREYFLYLPATLDTNRTYWLVAGIHGAGGNGQGAGGFSDWVNLGNCIVVGPTFPDGYQMLERETGSQLVDLADELAKTYRLQKRLFVAGFSGGAQFAHRFALRYPDRVSGCAAHSGGTWATGNLRGDMTLATNAPPALPFVISCGQKDEGRAYPDAPLTRIAWAHKFDELLQQRGFVYIAQFWPDTGHGLSPAARELTLECYSFATCGLTLNERRLWDKLLAGSTRARLQSLPAEFARARKQQPNNWHNLDKLRGELDRRAGTFVTEQCADYARQHGL